MKENGHPQNQDELAESYGITHQTMNNYMRMANMIPELDVLETTDIVTTDTQKIRILKHPHFLNFRLKYPGKLFIISVEVTEILDRPHYPRRKLGVR